MFPQIIIYKMSPTDLVTLVCLLSIELIHFCGKRRNLLTNFYLRINDPYLSTGLIICRLHIQKLTFQFVHCRSFPVIVIVIDIVIDIFQNQKIVQTYYKLITITYAYQP